MPFTTELATAKAPRLVTPNVSWPAFESRSSNATSDGEFTRVGTRPLGGFVESSGKRR